MGAGKSTVARAFATAAGIACHDLDRRIEAADGRSIATLFEEDGEANFRSLEGRALRSLELSSDAVVATGGGLPVDPANRRWMRRKGVIVWLDAPFSLMAARSIGGDRPLFDDEEAARRLYGIRLPAYQDCDHRVAVSEGQSVEQVVQSVVAALAE